MFILLSGDDPVIEAANLRVCQQRKVEGVFVCITPHTEDLSPFQRFQKLDLPIIFFDKVPSQNGFIKVCVADEQAALMAAEELIRTRRKKILALFGVCICLFRKGGVILLLTHFKKIGCPNN